jgi:glutathione peroxidase
MGKRSYQWIGLSAITLMVLGSWSLITRQSRPEPIVQKTSDTQHAPSPSSSKGLSNMTTQTPSPSAPSPNLFEGLSGGQIDLGDYAGKVVLVVNTASKCGFTGQYKGLETLYKARQDEGLVVIGVPSNDFGGQEPGSAEQIATFCEINYGVSFPLAAKTVVKGANAHPFYKDAVAKLGPSAQPAWNFHKVLIGKDGQPIAAFGSGVTPNAPELSRAIDAALQG